MRESEKCLYKSFRMLEFFMFFAVLFRFSVRLSAQMACQHNT